MDTRGNVQTEVEFSSSAFDPVLPEDAQINPQCYGAELSWWLCQKLMENGVATSYPGFEDWGWFIEYLVDDNEYWLCCGNVVGSQGRWKIYLKQHAKSMFGRNLAPIEGAVPLLKALREVLNNDDAISNIEWS